jgi:hypothetical protein
MNTTNCPSCGTQLEIVSEVSVVLNQIVPTPTVETPVVETPAEAVSDVVPTADAAQPDPAVAPETTSI